MLLSPSNENEVLLNASVNKASYLTNFSLFLQGMNTL